MVFSSLIFLYFFLPTVFVLHKVCPLKYRNILLLVFSLLFYAWGEPLYVVLMLAVIIFNWSIGRYAYGNKLIMCIAVFGNLTALVFFKYIDFIIDNINSILNLQIDRTNLPLPIGISFYIFQAISYVVDLYRKKYNPQKDFIKLALYISFFPQLIAGPIVRYVDINQQIDSRVVTDEKTREGISRFIYGLSKKVLIANVLAKAVDSVIALNTSDISFIISWMTGLMYFLQIYFDFSGYSDMAIGLGRMFGFDFIENFNYPYTAYSITDFWRRWHISLSTWFREYLYIPLGGNRKGNVRTYINIFLVFLATGIWHGASWNFVIWGLWHGSFRIIEKMGFERFLEKHKLFGHIYSVFVVLVGFTIFRIDDTDYLKHFLGIMFKPWKHGVGTYSLFEIVNNETLIAMAIGVICSGPILMTKNLLNSKADKIKGSCVELMVCIFLLIICIMELTSGTYNPFIYFRF